jgi:hypothetical protein
VANDPFKKIPAFYCHERHGCHTQNQLDLIQYGSEADDFEFDEVGSTLDVSPENAATCDQQVNQAASAFGRTAGFVERRVGWGSLGDAGRERTGWRRGRAKCVSHPYSVTGAARAGPPRFGYGGM